jgi:hypothetical protein
LTRAGAHPDGRAPWAVCVYCGSSTSIPAESVELAERVGAGIAARGWTLVSGGSRLSMMGAVARAARAGGARTVGVIPGALTHSEIPDPDADELLVTETMRERKALMDTHADAFLALPGGLGTLEELFEAWTAGVLGMHDKPVVLLDPAGHYGGLLDWLGGLVPAGYVPARSIERLAVHRDVDAALDACAGPDQARSGRAAGGAPPVAR